MKDEDGIESGGPPDVENQLATYGRRAVGRYRSFVAPRCRHYDAHSHQ